MNYYKRYLGDYARATAHLSLTEHGAYQSLLDAYYASDGALPNDEAELYRIARAMTPAERKAVDKVAGQYFAVNGDGTRHNKRADEELNAYRTQASTNQRIAVEREAKRKGHEPSTNRATDGDTKGALRGISREARSQKLELQDQKLSPADAGFTLFWQDWPKGERKQAKGKCLAVWKRKGLEAKAPEILAHIAALKDSEGWRNGFVPAPLVYLTQERWDGADAPSGSSAFDGGIG